MGVMAVPHRWSQVDLHLHTTASDGALNPAALVALARDRGLKVIAITDHDTTGGVNEALRAASRTDLTVIPGVELSAEVPGGELHVLGYYLRHDDPGLQEHLSLLRAGRLDRGQGIVLRLKDLGVDISWGRVQEIAGAAKGNTVGRPHIAQAMMEQGYVSTIAEAFDRYISNDGPAYVSRVKLTPEEAIRLIRATGGLSVIAHPIQPERTAPPDRQTAPPPAAASQNTALADGADSPAVQGGPPDEYAAPVAGFSESLDSALLAYDRWLPELIAAGLQGIECHYGRYTSDVVDRLVQLARKWGLVPTGGSDFHGPEVTPDNPLGGTPVPFSVAEELAERYRQVSATAASWLSL